MHPIRGSSFRIAIRPNDGTTEPSPILQGTSRIFRANIKFIRNKNNKNSMDFWSVRSSPWIIIAEISTFAFRIAFPLFSYYFISITVIAIAIFAVLTFVWITIGQRQSWWFVISARTCDNLISLNLTVFFAGVLGVTPLTEESSHLRILSPTPYIDTMTTDGSRRRINQLTIRAWYNRRFDKIMREKTKHHP